MRKMFLLAMALMVGFIFSSCATFSVKQPGGTAMKYHGPVKQSTAAMKLNPVLGPSEAYTQTMLACAEAVKKNPGATYIVDEDGGCTFIGDQKGILAYEAIWENAKSIDIFVVITSVKNKKISISFFVESGKYYLFNLLPGDYEYKVINPLDNQILDRGRFKADGYTSNAYSQMAGKKVSFVARTGGS